MKLTWMCVVLLAMVCLQPSQAWFGSVRRGYNFAKGAVKGTGSMAKSFIDMRRANWKKSDKYFHARGNHDAAKHGAGGRWAAEKISNAREIFDQRVKGDSRADSLADQKANNWGRSGGDPNKYRPKGLPTKY